MKKPLPQNEEQQDILQYVVDTKTASEIWELTDERVKQLARTQQILAKKIGNSWAIDIRQPNPKIYNKRKGEDEHGN